jgi:hypothetical protein
MPVHDLIDFSVVPYAVPNIAATTSQLGGLGECGLCAADCEPQPSERASGEEDEGRRRRVDGDSDRRKGRSQCTARLLCAALVELDLVSR